MVNAPASAGVAVNIKNTNLALLPPLPGIERFGDQGPVAHATG